MAKSIFEILDDLQTETSVPGQSPKMQPHVINRNQLPDSKIYEDEDALLDWFRNNNCLHAGLQKAVRSHLIDLRAAFKACKKADTWSNSYGQANLDAYTWDLHKRPNLKGSKASIDQARYADCMKAIASSLQGGLAPEMIHTVLDPVYGAEMITTCLDAIQNATA